MAPDTPTTAKRSRQAPCTAASLPEEILSEILLLLPSRSILRFRAVCRSWAALLSSPAFKDVYAAKARARLCASLCQAMTVPHHSSPYARALRPPLLPPALLRLRPRPRPRPTPNCVRPLAFT